MAKGHKDKVAVITGAANGIGQAFAKRLAEDGVHIAIVDLADGGDDREAGGSRRPPGARASSATCRRSSRSPPWPRTVNAKFSHVDIVINCAGIFPQKEFADMTFADWRQGAVDQSRRHVPGHRRLRARHAARANGAAWSTWRRGRSARWSPALRITSPAKAASSASPARWRAISAGDGITVNAIAPGLTRSPGTLVRAPRPGFKTMDDEFAAVAQMQAIKRAGSAGRSGRRGVVPHQRRRRLHHRADAERGRRPGADVRPP